MSKVTLITGLWDLGRNGLTEGWSRSYENHYLKKFEELLKIENNLIIFGDSDLEKFVWERRDQSNTQFITKDLNWFKTNEFYDKIQKIRSNPDWSNQVGWLSESTQARLEMYNPLIMCKMFLLHDAKIMDKFDSDYLFWIDAGLTNTVHSGYFTQDNVIDKLPEYINKFTFITFPYETTTEIHGFTFDNICEFAGAKVNKVARGGFFGGPKDTISEANNLYYQLLSTTLSSGYMGTEESIFSIMLYKYPMVFEYSEIEGNGLISYFFEQLKNNTVKLKCELSNDVVEKPKDINKVGLYVIGFNSPNQFETLIQSMLQYDRNFIDKPVKYLLDNSTDLSTTERYLELCNEYGFEHIKKENLGICGGRQFIAEHFSISDLEFMFFFEDDMFFNSKKDDTCRNGFNRYVGSLFTKSLTIIRNEKLDFLKLNFSEFYGDNSTQWSWYNVPQSVRELNWPNNKKLPVQGLDPNAPRTKFDVIKSYDGVPYSMGEVYYSNWPQIVSKEGNEKMFLETTWGHPYEQTWMSYMFQETVKGKIKSGILLLTPTEHDRFDFYDGSLRKES
jgi:hypothetical protein